MCVCVVHSPPEQPPSSVFVCTYSTEDFCLSPIDIFSISPHRSTASFELRLDAGRERRLAVISDGPENEPSLGLLRLEDDPLLLAANMACSS